MEPNELFLLLFKVSCITLSVILITDSIIGIVKLKRAKLAQFFVKTAFAFERGEFLVGSLVYYNEPDIQKELQVTGLNLGEYVKEYLPSMNLPVEPVTVLSLHSLNMPARTLIRKDLVEKYSTLIIQSSRTMIIINKLGSDPRASWWFGLAIVSNNENVIKIITSKYRKAKKHDPNCYVVRT